MVLEKEKKDHVNFEFEFWASPHRITASDCISLTGRRSVLISVVL